MQARLLLLALLLGTGALQTACSTGDTVEPLTVSAEPVPLFLDRADDRFGSLLYQRGLHLTSENRNFGGFSGLDLLPDGRIVMVSDLGYWLEAGLDKDDEGAIQGLKDARMGRLRNTDGAVFASKVAGDSEEIHPFLDHGWLVSFEQDHRILFYPTAEDQSPLDGAAVPFPHPPGIRDLPSNKGIEAFVALADGRLLVFSEDLRPNGTIAWLGRPAIGAKKVDWQILSLRDRENFQPTGAALLPSGDVLLLERNFRRGYGNRVLVSRIAYAQLQPGVTLQPDELGLIEPPAKTDNMEAVAVERGPRGETLIYLLSDDNFQPSEQRTLLWQLQLIEAVPEVKDEDRPADRAMVEAETVETAESDG